MSRVCTPQSARLRFTARRRATIAAALACAAGLLGACTRANDDPAGPSADEDRQLNAAAARLDAAARPVPAPTPADGSNESSAP